MQMIGHEAVRIYCKPFVAGRAPNLHQHNLNAARFFEDGAALFGAERQKISIKSDVVERLEVPWEAWGHATEVARGDQCHFFDAASRNPSNSGLNSPVRQKFSGCHCTPRQKRAAGSSIASTTPSGAVADTLNPAATCFTA